MANRNTKRNAVKHKTGKGNPVDSTKQRELRGRRSYDAPTMRQHPRSGLNNQEMRLLAT